MQIDFFTMIGVKTAEHPKTSSKLQIFEPITLPIATLALPPSIREVMESDTETASSGQLVPIATIVRPMINSEICNFLAIALLASTNMSQNFTKHKTPTIKAIINAIILKATGQESTNVKIIILTP